VVLSNFSYTDSKLVFRIGVKGMTIYGDAAIEAVELIVSQKITDPAKAWNIALHNLGLSDTILQKACPKSAFLGLCKEGLVKGVPRGNYTRSIKNKAYSLHAVQILRSEPELVGKKGDLWKRVGHLSKDNGQMDVVISLWQKGLIK
jgi:hypothetical protein